MTADRSRSSQPRDQVPYIRMGLAHIPRCGWPSRQEWAASSILACAARAAVSADGSLSALASRSMVRSSSCRPCSRPMSLPEGEPSLAQFACAVRLRPLPRQHLSFAPVPPPTGSQHEAA
jgi:hypothetical protein